MLNGIIPNLRQYLDKDALVLDILPYMLEILQPRLRQVNLFFSSIRILHLNIQTNIALFTNKEMRDIKTLIDVMITFNLSYIQQRTALGENVLELEP